MQPQSPVTDKPYEFIFKESQKPKKNLLPKMSGPVMIIAVIIGLMILTIIFSSIFLGKGKASVASLADVIGRAQEINRVNALEAPSLKDVTTADLLATSQTVLLSEQSQLNAYAKANKIKISSKTLAAYKNPQTDTTLQKAAQNNNLDSSYAAYLNTALADYSISLTKAYQTTKQTNLKIILKEAYDSTQTLLGNPPKTT